MISHELQGTIALLRLAGDLDWVSAPELESRIDQLVRQGSTDIRIDMQGVTFCDAAALSAFIRCNERCRVVGGRLSLTGARGIVVRILTITGLDRVFVVD